jgi:hypothetical protein
LPDRQERINISKINPITMTLKIVSIATEYSSAPALSSGFDPVVAAVYDRRSVATGKGRRSQSAVTIYLKKCSHPQKKTAETIARSGWVS